MKRFIERRKKGDARGWGSQYAFAIESAEDIPENCRKEYRESCGKLGTPLLAFFSSAIANSISDYSPRIVLLFADVIHVITLPNGPLAVNTLEVSRSHLIGYGIADFVLDAWFTLYYGVQPSGVAMIPFNACATGLYRKLGCSLWNWIKHGDGEDNTRPNVLSFDLPERLPLRFFQFLQSHPEIRLRADSIFQTGLAVSRWRKPFWPSLLLGIADGRLVVISDQYDGYPSTHGVEATSLSLRAVSRIVWVDRIFLRQARIAIDVEQQGRSLQFSWPACPQLRATALNWIEWANYALVQARQCSSAAPEPNESEGVEALQRKILVGDLQTQLVRKHKTWPQ